MQQMQLIGSGSQGPQAATAIRQAAAQQGVWSLGNFGGMPPQASAAPVLSQQQQQQQQPVAAPDASHPTKVQENDYRAIFNSAGVGMAIASMGGGFIDCNPLFCSVSNYSKQELCSLTIFSKSRRSFDVTSVAFTRVLLTLDCLSYPFSFRSHRTRIVTTSL